MIRILSALAFIVMSMTAVSAADSAAIAQRRALLKQFGEVTKGPGAMLKGEAPFDLAAAQAALKVYQDNAAKLPELFPDDSKTGDTNALPAIWEGDNKKDIAAKYAKFAADAKAASAAIKDEATFKAEFGKVLGNCGGCHKPYRKPQA